ncbi:MAG: DUF2752 domain-containing protein [Tannerella sp.]|jgi:hypothetical protein|nr:DUF2752 domain-containing protein [Tannerella sp.]
MSFKIILLAAAILTGGILYYRFNPAESPLFPKCPFLLLTGLKCPGCGSQRTIHALLHGDLCTAFLQNALLVCTLPYLFLLLLAKAIRRRSPYASFPVRIQRPAIIWTYFVLVMLFWITRNVFGF